MILARLIQLVTRDYPDMLRTEGLPRAISVNQFGVELVKDPEDPKAQETPEPGKPIISDMVAAGKLRIVGGVYELATGKVTMV